MRDLIRVTAERGRMVGEAVRSRRLALQLRLEDVASRSGLSLATVARIERGSDTTVSTLAAIAKALETTVGELVGNGEAA